MATEILPSGLIRFWLQWHYRHHRLNVPGFADEIKATPAAVHNWMSGERGNRRGISEQYWPHIARFFLGPAAQPEQLLAAARRLYSGTTKSAAAEVQLEHPATPELVAEYLRESDEARTPHRRPRPARQARARKTHGTPRGV